jgi:hypothetical protein
VSRIPQHFIDDLMTRVDIVEVITARVPLKKAGREYKACCPFHDEKTSSRRSRNSPGRSASRSPGRPEPDLAARTTIFTR